MALKSIEEIINEYNPEDNNANTEVTPEVNQEYDLNSYLKREYDFTPQTTNTTLPTQQINQPTESTVNQEEVPSFDFKSFTNQVEASGKKGLGFHNPEASSAYGDYGITNTALKEIAARDPYFKDKKLQDLNSEDQSKAFDVYRQVQADELKAQGIAPTDENLSRAWVLGASGLKNYLASGKYSDATLIANSPKNLNINNPADKAKMIDIVTEIDDSRRLGYTIPELRKAKEENRALAPRFGTSSNVVPQTARQESFDLVDADTYALRNGMRIRIEGINARETPQFDFEKGTFKGGDFGGQYERNMVQDIITKYGFNIPTYNANKKDNNNRFIGDLLNAKGEKLSDFLLRNNLTSTTQFSTEQQKLSSAVGRIEAASREAREPLDRFQQQAAGIYDLENPVDLIGYQLRGDRSRLELMTKDYAPEAKQYGQRPDLFAGPSMVRQGENRGGIATSTWSTGVDFGFNNFKRSFANTLDMAYYALDNKEGRKDFKRTKEYYDRVESELPFLANPEAFDSETGEWKLNTFDKFTDWFIGTAAQSSIDFPMAIVSSALLVPTFGLSAIPGALRYAGEVWNDQPEKNLGAALAGGALMVSADLLGAAGVLSQMGIKEQGKKIVTDLMKKGYTKEVAEQMFIKQSKDVFKQFANVLKAGVIGGAEEGATEALQDTIGYFAKQGFDTTISDPNQFKNQLLNSFMGGLALGGGISAGGKAINLATDRYDTTPNTSDADFRNENYLSKNKQIPFVYQVIDKATSENIIDETTLDKLASPEESKRSTAGLVQQAKNWWKEKGLGSLFYKGWDKVIGQYSTRGEAMAAAATLVGASNSLNGGNLYTEKDVFAGMLNNKLGPLRSIIDSFNGLKKQSISDIMYKKDVKEFINQVLTHAKKGISFEEASDLVDAGKILTPQNYKYVDGIINLSSKLHNMSDLYNERVNKKTKQNFNISNLLDKKDLNKESINRNRKQFINDLRASVSGISYNDAVKYLNSIMRNDNSLINDLELNSSLADEAQNATFSSAFISNAIKNDKTGLMNKYIYSNLFDNVSHFIESSSNRYINDNYLGKDGSKIAALLQQAVKNNEIDLEEAGFLAKEFKDFIKVRTGDYHSVDNQLINGGLNLLSFLTTISSLPLAAISSVTEFGLVMRNLNTPQTLKAYQNLLSTLSKDLYSTVKEIGNTGKYHNLEHRNKLSSAGFETGEQSIANRYDIQSGVYSKLTGSFFKFTGLQSVTNATRAARLSIAKDAIENWYKTVLPALKDKTKMNQQEQDAYEHLIRIGFDPVLFGEVTAAIPTDKFSNYSSAEQDILAVEIGNMQAIAEHNFVNEAVVNPNPLNRPKFYSDPYLRLFTLFQGYMSTFTANILPRLYGDLTKRGSTDQKNAVATIGTMIALSMFALLLKDLIKFGESPPDWLEGDEEKLMQRLVGATGLLGTGERVLNFVNPMIENKSGSSFERLYNVLEGESPIISYTAKAARAMDAVISGKDDAPKKVLKVAPFVGSINQLGDYVNDQLKGK